MPRPGARAKAKKAEPLPSGTVTFLFTDIEGSTQRWDAHRDAMRTAVARHDALLRAVCERHGGVVFKTVGDAFCVAFRRPQDALEAALDVQHVLHAEDFSSVGGLAVRMALHTGAADERDGDYFGQPVNRVARLLAIGHGGQVLVSGTTANLLQGVLPKQASLRDLGEHTLRDLSRPEQVYQLIAPGLQEAYPPLRSLDVLPNNLPSQPTSFVGRAEELADVKALLEKSPMVTLVGTGGVGKTRVALQVGADLLDGSGDGVWCVDLAQVTSAEFVLPEIASALGVLIHGDRPVLDELRFYLRNKRLLLILDNCEHVVAEASRFAATVLKDCPNVKVLATSREGLNVRGEQLYRMPSLALPPPRLELSAADALQYGAVGLFVARASAADARFTFDDNKAAIVADICRRLDGIALAIELAAARVTILNVNQLAQRLGERFRLLTGGDRTALPRQQTMRAAIDWSYELLTDDERRLFRRLSIFQGGWTLEAASEVCSDQTLDQFGVLDKLSSLVNKSLAAVEFSGESQRYRLLESLRQYGLDLLQRSGEFDEVARRHATYVHALVVNVLRDWTSSANNVWLAVIDSEIDNVRAALEWSLSQRNDPVLGADIAQLLFAYWMTRDLLEGKRWTEMAVPLIDAQEQPALFVGVALAMTRMILGTTPENVVAETERALQAARTYGDEQLLVRALFYRGEALNYEDRPDEAEPFLTEGLALARKLDNRYRISSTLQMLARLNRKRGQLETARALSDEALELAKDTPIERNRAVALIDRAALEMTTGHSAEAMELIDEVQEIAHMLDDRSLAVMAQICRAYYEAAAGSIDQARTDARSALAASLDRLSGIGLSTVLRVLARVATMQGDLAQAARLIGYARVSPRAWRFLEDTVGKQDPDWLIEPLREGLGDGGLQQIMAEGAAWSPDHAIEEALNV